MKAKFIRKAVDIEELRAETASSKAHKCEYIVEKCIVLSKQEFEWLCQDFFGYKSYIEENLECMYNKDKAQHCLLVTCKEKDFGILIQSEGYSYARYTAIVEVET